MDNFEKLGRIQLDIEFTEQKLENLNNIKQGIVAVIAMDANEQQVISQEQKDPEQKD